MSRAQLTSTVEQSSGGAVSPFLAGKNKIINGDFGIWQRGTSFGGASQYTADRWNTYSDSAATISQQTFTPGTAPVAGYESAYFLRSARTSGGSYANIVQKIEDVRTFAGQTFTFSFWAKASASQTITIRPQQVFGTGGSSNVVFTSQTANVTTSWARYSATFAAPSIAGQTIGTGSHLFAELYWLTTAAVTMDIWGVQLEVGSVATPFTTASNTVQGELALCQRYYISNGQVITWQGNVTSGQLYIQTVTFPVQMRVAPTITQTSYSASNFNAGTLSAGTITVGGFLTNETASGTASGAYYQATYTASAEL